MALEAELPNGAKITLEPGQGPQSLHVPFLDLDMVVTGSLDGKTATDYICDSKGLGDAVPVAKDQEVQFRPADYLGLVIKIKGL